MNEPTLGSAPLKTAMIHGDRRTLPSARGVLLCVLSATMVAPVWLWRSGAASVPWGLSATAYVLIASAMASLYVLWHGREEGFGIGVRYGLARAAVVALLSLILATVVEERANQFYTANALIDGMAVLVGCHVVSEMLRRATAAVEERVWSKRKWWPATARDLGDDLVTIETWTVVAFWFLSIYRAREVALGLMLVAGFSAVLTVFVRLADVGRHYHRRRRASC